MPESAAEAAGLEIKDVVTMVNGKPVESVPMLALELSRYAAGDGVTLATVPENRRTESWWIVRRDGMPVAGKSGAGIVLLTELPLTRRLGRLRRKESQLRRLRTRRMGHQAQCHDGGGRRAQLQLKLDQLE